MGVARERVRRCCETANRPWVIHEISQGWNKKKGILGIRIDRLLGTDSHSSVAGPNPFSKVSLTGTRRSLADMVPLKNPAGTDSKAVYASIANNVEAWIEEAIRIRANS